MRMVFSLLLLLSIPSKGVAEEAKTTPCPIVPVPKEYKSSGKTIVIPERNQRRSIVLGEKCTEAEQYAAARLQTFVERRFKENLPIRLENEIDKELKCVVLLGQRSTNTWLDRLCKSNRIDLNTLPVFWHNQAEVDGGFLHSGRVVTMHSRHLHVFSEAKPSLRSVARPSE